MNIFHHHLEAVEATGFWHLDFSAEPLSQVFENDAITCGEESENVLYEVLLILG